VQLVKKHLDVLRDGVLRLKMDDAELTVDAIQAVGDAHATLSFQAAQLAESGVDATNVKAAAARVTAQLASERPWRDIAVLEQDLREIRAAYVAERQRLLEWQGREVEAVRQRVKGRDDFSTLSADHAHRVLRPLEQALSDTDANAVAPSLTDLRDPFRVRLRRAEDEANETLDALLSEGQGRLVKPVDLALRNRELATEADIEALVSDIRARLLEQIRAGARVRLV
jgi:hypothetical protein